MYEADFQKGEDEDESFPCPGSWFTKTLEEWALVEKTKCNVLEIDSKMPIDMKMRHLAAISVLEKAKPYLEKKNKKDE